jgi:hypothetical protein
LGLRIPTALESTITSNISSNGSIPSQASRNSRALLVTIAVR